MRSGYHPDDKRNRIWVLFAACRGADTRIFFPVNGNLTKDAEALCNACPARNACREYGQEEVFGTWGGIPESARGLTSNALRRQRWLREKASK